MSSAFSQYFSNFGQSLLLRDAVIGYKTEPAITQLVNTIKLLQAGGKIPILFSPPPSGGFNVGDCLERQAIDALILGRSGCDIAMDRFPDHENEIIAALREVEDKTDVRLVWLDSVLCDEGTCQTRIGDVYIYRDSGHLSHAGSVLVLSALELLPVAD